MKQAKGALLQRCFDLRKARYHLPGFHRKAQTVAGALDQQCLDIIFQRVDDCDWPFQGTGKNPLALRLANGSRPPASSHRSIQE